MSDSTPIRCEQVWWCQTAGCGFVVTLRRGGYCASFGPARACPFCGVAIWKLMEHRDLGSDGWQPVGLSLRVSNAPTPANEWEDFDGPDLTP